MHLSCHVMSCHVMSCHVAIIVSNFLKNYFQKLYHFSKLFINILQASLLVIMRIATLSLAMTVHFLVITRATPATKSGRRQVISLIDCFALKMLAMTMKFNLISFRDFSLLFIKKFITKGDLNYVKSQNNF